MLTPIQRIGGCKEDVDKDEEVGDNEEEWGGQGTEGERGQWRRGACQQKEWGGQGGGRGIVKKDEKVKKGENEDSENEHTRRRK